MGVDVRAVVMLVVQVVIGAKAVGAAVKTHARCTKNAGSFEGNPSKRLKYGPSHVAYKKFQSQSIQGKSK